jgi:phospholipid N-methyltransferase
MPTLPASPRRPLQSPSPAPRAQATTLPDPALPHPEPKATRGSGWVGFFKEFIRSPKSIGACFPCSRRLGRRMIEGIDVESAGAVVEFGPGTGTVTRAILERLGKDTRFLTIERNPTFAAMFRQRHPTVPLVEGDAADVRAICRSAGLGPLRCIISGLPLLLFDEPTRNRILAESVQALEPGGVFAQVTYCIDGLPAAKATRRLMEQHFTTVRPRKVVWRNIPPAFVYQCVRETPAA